jgi:integrase
MSSVAKRPNGKWRARYEDAAGKEHARHFERKADATTWLATQVHKVTEGTWVDPMAGKRTFEEYAQQWASTQIQHRPSTAAVTRSRLKTQLLPYFGHRPIAAIQRSEVQAWVAERSQTLKPSTVEGLYRLMAQIMLAAVDDRVVSVTPCRKIVLPQQERGRVVIPTMEEIDAIMAVAPDRAQALILTAVATGMRISEICGLTVDRVDFLRRTVTVDRQLSAVVAGRPRFGPPKTAAGERSIPVPASVTDALAAHLAQWPSQHCVFTNERGFPMLRQRLSDLWKGWCGEAGVTCRFHDLRHLYASSLIAAGQSVKVIQQRMGHGSAAITLDVYGHLLPSDEDGTRLAIDGVIRSLGTGRGLG